MVNPLYYMMDTLNRNTASYFWYLHFSVVDRRLTHEELRPTDHLYRPLESFVCLRSLWEKGVFRLNEQNPPPSP